MATSENKEIETEKEYERLKALATNKFKEKKYVEAVKYFNEACAVIYTKGDPTKIGYYVVCKNNVAQCCINLTDYKGAIKYATEALLHDPKNSKALYRRGISLLKLNQIKEALVDLKLCLESDADNKEVEKEYKKAASLCLIDVLLKSKETVQKKARMTKLNELIAIGADVNFVDTAKKEGIQNCPLPPLMIASQQGDDDIVDLLLSNGANVHFQENEHSCGAISIACMSGHVEVTDLLLSKGANIRERSSNDGSTPIIHAARGGHVNVIKLLLSKGANINDKVKDGSTSLIIAAKYGYIDTVKFLLSKGACVRDKVTNVDNSSVLYIASQEGHADVVELLLSKGADVKDVNLQGANSLLIASQEGHVKVMKLLLSKGGNVDHKSCNSSTPLIAASQDNRLEAVEFLLKQGANINSKTREGGSSLYFATMKGHDKVVKLLLSKGANVNSRDNNGNSSLMLACAEGHLDIAKLLLSYGASLHYTCNINPFLGYTCFAMSKTKEIKSFLKNWNVTMLIIVLQELRVLNALDPSSFIDLRKYMG